MLSNYYRYIRTRYILAVGAVILLLGCLFSLHIMREREIELANAEKRSASYASALKEHAERVFSEADNTLEFLVNEANEHGGLGYTQTSGFHKIMSERAKAGSLFSSIYVVNKSANIVAHSLEFGIAPINLADRDYFRYHRDTPTSGLYISKPFLSKVSKTWRFSLSRPLRDSRGKFTGLISVTFESDYFAKFYKTIDVGTRGRIVLATTLGETLVVAPLSADATEPDFKSSSLFSASLKTASSGTYHIAVPRTNDVKILSYHLLSDLPVVAVVSLDQTEILEPWVQGIYKQSVIALLLVIVFCVLSSLFLKQVRRLEEVNVQFEVQQKDLELRVKLLDAASDAILLLDGQGHFVYFNNALAGMTGYSREELERVGLHEIEPPEYAERIRSNIDFLLTHGEAIFESAYLRKSGAILPLEVHAHTLTVNGQTLVLAVVRDITERKETEQRLIATSLEWQNTFDAVEDAVWLLDLDRRIIRANHASQLIFGKPVLDVVGMHCCQATYGKDMPRRDCPFEEMLETRKRATAQLTHDNVWYEVAVDPIFDEQGEIVRAAYIVKNINSLKRTEHREQVRAGILERIASGEKLSQLLTYIASSIEKENPQMLCSILLVSDDGKRLLNGAAPSLPDFYNIATHRTKIGEGIGSCGTAAFRRERVVVEDIETHPFWKGFQAARDAGLRSCWSEPIISSTGELLGTFAIYHRTSVSPAEDEISLIQQASAFAGIAIERSKSEDERSELEQLLSQSQKMEAIGHLSGGIAHDFNNLLTPILIYTDMLKRSLPDNDKVRSQLDGIVKAAGKARDLTQQLLSFGRKQVMQMRVVDLNDIVMSFHSMVRRTLRENISISLQLANQPMVLRADSSKLEQVILNLALNAQDAIAANGSISFETGLVLVDDEFANRHPGMSAGRFVLLSCSDTGCGMTGETLSRIFEPFFSTKEVGHGTGLGLANVYGIVKQHGGYIMAVSTVGVGTTFKIYLPACDEQPQDMVAEKHGDTIDHAGDAVILLVEDNEMVREMSRELLVGLGYQVYSAELPEQALEIVRQTPGNIDLVITDVVMPGMNGRQLFEQITLERPDIGKVLYISGYTNNVILSETELGDGLPFLQKPFTVDALMHKVKELLAS